MTKIDPTSAPSGSPGISAAEIRELVEVRARYHNICNEIVRPRSQIRETRYFWRKWRKILGATLTIIIIEARDRCFRNMETGEERNYFSMSLEEFAEACDINERTLRRALQHEHAEKFIRLETKYRYDPILKKKVRDKTRFEVFLDDPLTPDDQVLLAKKLNEHELQSLLAQGVVDLAQYVALKERSPTGQIVQGEADLPDKMSARSSDLGSDENQREIDLPDKMSARSNAPESHENHLTDKMSARCNDNTLISFPKMPLLNSTYNTLASTTDRDDGPEPEQCPSGLEKTVAAVIEKFDHCISEQTVFRLIETTSPENVRNQLDWFDHRDSSWATRGPAAAFVTYCRQQAGEPETIVRAVRAEERRAAEQAEQKRRDDYEQFALDEFKRLTESMPEAEFRKLKDEVMAALKQLSFWRNLEEASPVFQANLQARVLELGGVPKLEEWQG